MPDRLGPRRHLPGGQIPGQNGKRAPRDGITAQPGHQPAAPGRPHQHRRRQPPPRPRPAAHAHAASDRMNDFAGSLTGTSDSRAAEEPGKSGIMAGMICHPRFLTAGHRPELSKVDWHGTLANPGLVGEPLEPLRLRSPRQRPRSSQSSVGQDSTQGRSGYPSSAAGQLKLAGQRAQRGQGIGVEDLGGHVVRARFQVRGPRGRGRASIASAGKPPLAGARAGISYGSCPDLVPGSGAPPVPVIGPVHRGRWTVLAAARACLRLIETNLGSR